MLCTEDFIQLDRTNNQLLSCARRNITNTHKIKNSSIGYCINNNNDDQDDYHDKDYRLSPDGASTAECSPENTFIKKSVNKYPAVDKLLYYLIII